MLAHINSHALQQAKGQAKQCQASTIIWQWLKVDISIRSEPEWILFNLEGLAYFLGRSRASWKDIIGALMSLESSWAPSRDDAELAKRVYFDLEIFSMRRMIFIKPARREASTSKYATDAWAE